jgi:hypothetical protein
VGFVADDQIKIGQAILVLGVADDANGMVGAEDSADVLAVVRLSISAVRRAGLVRLGRRNS